MSYNFAFESIYCEVDVAADQSVFGYFGGIDGCWLTDGRALPAIDMSDIMIQCGIDDIGNMCDFCATLARPIVFGRLTAISNITILIVSHMRFRRLISCQFDCFAYIIRDVPTITAFAQQ